MTTSANPSTTARSTTANNVAPFENDRPKKLNCSEGDGKEKFSQAMADHSLYPPQIIADGCWHRFATRDKKTNDKSGFYILHEDSYGRCWGAFGDWSQSSEAIPFSSFSEASLTCEQRQEWAARRAEQQRLMDEEAANRREAGRQKAKAELADMQPAPGDFPYFAKKNVGPVYMVYYSALEEAIVIPAYNMEGVIQSYQRIFADGEKRFMAGGSPKGAFFGIGGDESVICICEGYATAYSVWEAMGRVFLTICAFNAGNLPSVAEQFRLYYPQATLVVCADNDHTKTVNAGLKYAKIASEAVDGIVVSPPTEAGISDFNDLQAAHGKDAVKAIIENTLSMGTVISSSSKIAEIAVAGHEEWENPMPLSETEARKPYPINVLPKTIAAAVNEVVDFVQCPAALAACSSLAAVSAAVQGIADVRRAEGLQGPTGIFLLAIADSGERKSTVDGLFSNPILDWERVQYEEIKPAIAEYNAAHAAWDAEKSGILSAIKDASKKGDPTEELKGRLSFLENMEPIKPMVPRLIYSDATPEALAYGLSKYPVGAMLSAEAGAILGGHAMSKESQMRNLSLLNSLWSREPITIDRRSNPSFSLRSVRLTVGLAVQPETLKSFLETSSGLARGIGFLARFLIAWPESTQGKRKFREPPKTLPALERYRRRLTELLPVNGLPVDENQELSPALLCMDEAAKKVWVKFHDDIEEELSPGREMEDAKDIASKTADQAARLAAIFHVFENGPSGMIGAESMVAGAKVAAWHLYEARRFLRENSVHEQVSLAIKLDNWLVARAKQTGNLSFTFTEIQRFGPRAIRKKAILESVLIDLREAGRVRLSVSGKTIRIDINPYLVQSSGSF